MKEEKRIIISEEDVMLFVREGLLRRGITPLADFKLNITARKTPQSFQDNCPPSYVGVLLDTLVTYTEETLNSEAD